jgi:hypothetical protein
VSLEEGLNRTVEYFALQENVVKEPV